MVSGQGERKEGREAGQEHVGGGTREITLSFSILASSLEYNCKVKFFGIVTTPSGNINYIEQNLFSLLKSQPKTLVK